MKTATMRTIARAFLTVFAAACVLSVCAILSACGGGGDDDEQASTQPVNCQANPEKCK